MQHIDPTKRRDTSINYRRNVIRAGHVSSDCLADAAFRLGSTRHALADCMQTLLRQPWTE